MSASAICKNIVLTDLARQRLAPPRRPSVGRAPPETIELARAELATVRFLSVREAPSRWTTALTVENRSGERYFAVYHLTERVGAGWQTTGCLLGPDRVRPGKPDPFLSLGAFCTEGVFFAGGRLQDSAGVVARIELAWKDGQTLTDRIENGVALFLANRDTIDPATVSFFGADGRYIASHPELIDEPPDS